MFLILKTLWVLYGKNTHEQIIIYGAVRERFLKMQLRSWECRLFVIELVKEAVLVTVLVEQTTSRQESKPGDLRLSSPMLVACLNSTWNTRKHWANTCWPEVLSATPYRNTTNSFLLKPLGNNQLLVSQVSSRLDDSIRLGCYLTTETFHFPLTPRMAKSD